MKSLLFLLFLQFLINLTSSAEVGEECILETTEVAGTCKFIRNCPPVLASYQRQSVKPTMCDLNNKSSRVVCCPNPKVEPTTTPRPARNSISVTKCQEYAEKSFILNRNIQQRFDFPNNQESASQVLPRNRNFPHLAQVIKSSGSLICIGSLISESFVLSAASCANNQNEDVASYVRLGLLPNDKNALNSKLIEILYRLIHPQYTEGLIAYDIALFQLKNKVAFTPNIIPICLSAVDETKPEEQLEIFKNFNGIKMELISIRDCRTSYEYDEDVETEIDFQTMICASKTSTSNTCHKYKGDLGGPLEFFQGSATNMYTIVGVEIQQHERCADYGDKRVYSKVNRYLDWIEGLVWGD